MREIKLSQHGKNRILNLVALVDDEDYEYLNQWKWYAKKDPNAKTYYAARVLSKGHIILMHRVILGITDGKLFGDHIDLNGLNNQRSNLRIATKSQNGANVKCYKNNSSGYLGVFWNKQKKKWTVDITKNGKTTHIGNFQDREVAAFAYNQAAKIYHGEFANLNKVG